MQPLRSLDRGENEALSDLYRRYAPALLTHLRANMQSIEDAEDLLLDVFLAALERDALRALAQEEQRRWLWRVTRNKLVDYYRKHTRRQHIPLGDTEEATYEDDELGPERVVLRNEEQRNLSAAIELLPSLQKEILLLRFVDGLHAPEIARLLGKRDAAVRVQLSRTLNLLRKNFGKLLR